FETSTIKLSKSALRNNISFIRGKLKKGVRLCSVVKGNAYGHGDTEFVNMAMDAGIDYFGVYSAEEAYNLKINPENNPDLFIMGVADDDAIEWAINNEIE